MYIALLRRGIETIPQLKDMTKEEILEIRGVGQISYEYITIRLEELADSGVQERIKQRDTIQRNLESSKEQIETVKKILSSYDDSLSKRKKNDGKTLDLDEM